jgi:hypothetical protein
MAVWAVHTLTVWSKMSVDVKIVFIPAQISLANNNKNTLATINTTTSKNIKNVIPGWPAAMGNCHEQIIKTIHSVQLIQILPKAKNSQETLNE